MVNAIASCRIPSDEYLIGVYGFVKDKATDDDGEKVYEVGLPPHVPHIITWSWDEPYDPLGHLVIVEVEVVVILLVVYLLRAASSAMQSED